MLQLLVTTLCVVTCGGAALCGLVTWPRSGRQAHFPTRSVGTSTSYLFNAFAPPMISNNSPVICPCLVRLYAIDRLLITPVGIFCRVLHRHACGRSPGSRPRPRKHLNSFTLKLAGTTSSTMLARRGQKFIVNLLRSVVGSPSPFQCGQRQQGLGHRVLPAKVLQLGVYHVEAVEPARLVPTPDSAWPARPLRRSVGLSSKFVYPSRRFRCGGSGRPKRPACRRLPVALRARRPEAVSDWFMPSRTMLPNCNRRTFCVWPRSPAARPSTSPRGLPAADVSTFGAGHGQGGQRGPMIRLVKAEAASARSIALRNLAVEINSPIVRVILRMLRIDLRWRL